MIAEVLSNGPACRYVWLRPFGKQFIALCTLISDTLTATAKLKSFNVCADCIY